MEHTQAGPEQHNTSKPQNPSARESEPALSDYMWQRRHDIAYDIELSAIYHRRRERFFDLFDKTSKALAILGGSAVLSRLVDEHALWIAAAIAIPTTIALVASTSERACRHAVFARDYRQLLAEIQRRGERDFTEAELDAWRARFTSLEAGEPRQLSALVRLCQNEIARRTRSIEYPVPFIQRVFAHFWDFGGEPVKQ